MQSISKAIAWLCLSLMLASVWTAVTHRHENEASSSSCQVCASAHSVAPAIASPTPKPVFCQVYGVSHHVTDPAQQFLVFALYTRPPPIV